MWDTEVDIACIGAGFGSLASAIATVNAGGQVLVADASPAHGMDSAPGTLRERVRTKRGWLIHSTLDAETDEYLAAVADGLADVIEVPSDASVPTRTARNLSREEAHGRHVEPFVGSRLPKWASKCLSSPYGLMYTSMRDWRTTTMRSADDGLIEVTSIGTMEWRDGNGEGSLRQWMSDLTRERDIEVRAASTLERLVFEDGVIIGVVLSTPEGPYAVRTRAGVTFSPADQDASIYGTSDHAAGELLHVCLVGRTASRFGRVELMATEPITAPRPTCTGSRRQYRDGMHDSRQPALDGWRCGKAYGYPPFGQ